MKEFSLNRLLVLLVLVMCSFPWRAWAEAMSLNAEDSKGPSISIDHKDGYVIDSASFINWCGENAYLSRGNDGALYLNTIPANTRKPISDNFSWYSANCTPDGHNIVFNKYNDDGLIETVLKNISSQKETAISNGIYSVHISPDNKKAIHIGIDQIEPEETVHETDRWFKVAPEFKWRLIPVDCDPNICSVSWLADSSGFRLLYTDKSGKTVVLNQTIQKLNEVDLFPGSDGKEQKKISSYTFNPQTTDLFYTLESDKLSCIWFYDQKTKKSDCIAHGERVLSYNAEASLLAYETRTDSRVQQRIKKITQQNNNK